MPCRNRVYESKKCVVSVVGSWEDNKASFLLLINQC